MKDIETKQEINDVLSYQEKQLKEIHRIDPSEIDELIYNSEELLSDLGYALPNIKKDGELSKRTISISEWDDIVIKARESVGSGHEIEELFSKDELMANKEAVRAINHDFKQIYRLDKYDYAICVCTGLLAAATDILLVGIPGPGKEGTEAGSLSNWIRDRFRNMIPDEKVTELENSKLSKVPFDAQDNRNTHIQVEGLSAYYHRLLELGHDPLLGFIVGVYDIMNGTMTTVDKSGRFMRQVMANYSDRVAINLYEAISKEFTHLMSDVNTSMGLPVPLMSLFNFLQFGKIGEEELNIAEIVQGMYYQGYDFIHFFSMSIPVMLVEVLTRLCYTIRRMNEGIELKNALAISTDREKNPKLATMMFISHSIAAAANAGKVYLSKKPEAINYPQWVAFTISSYKQLKWSIIDKPALANDYFSEKIYNELSETYGVLDVFMDRYYVIV